MRALWVVAVVACGSSSPKQGSPGPGSGSAVPPTAQVTQTSEEAEKDPPVVEAVGDDQMARDASIAFLTVLRESKGKIGRCHEAAVAKNAALENRTVALAVAADFAADGTLAKLTLAPSLGADFEVCVKAIAAGWTLTLTRKMSFRASMNLTP